MITSWKFEAIFITIINFFHGIRNAIVYVVTFFFITDSLFIFEAFTKLNTCPEGMCHC